VSSPAVAPPESRAIACRLCRGAPERAAHFAVRRAVFVDEQAMFAGDDRDERDQRVTTLHAVGLAGGRVAGAVRLPALGLPGAHVAGAVRLPALGLPGAHVAGAVRLYPLGGGEWKGDRLAVLPAARHGMLGARLVRFAVATAGARGGARMVAMIQLPNVAFFESLGWQRDGTTVAFHGRPHQPMAIALSRNA
jgi:predicted GNAT family N-acyltransferase